MDNQQLINTIATLAGSIDPLIRAGESEAITFVVKKMLNLIEKLEA